MERTRAEQAANRRVAALIRVNSALPEEHVHRFSESMTKKIVHHATRTGETYIGFVNRIVKERLTADDDES